MARFGLIGASYAADAVNADAQVTSNWYLEANESGAGKSAFQLVPTPGLKTFSAGIERSVRALEVINGRVFAVAGVSFYEIFADGTRTMWNLGTPMPDDGKRAYIACSELQCMVVAGGSAYCFDLTKNTFAPITIDATSATAIQGPVTMGGFADGYFIVLLSNSKKFQITNLPNSTCDTAQWLASEIGNVSQFADNVLTLLIDHKEIVLLGSKQSVLYYNSGNNLFPYSPIPGSYIEGGTAAPDSWCQADNSFYYIQGDARGRGQAVKASGYTPTRISNHAIETAWSRYPTISDAIGYSYTQRGHTFVCFYFPTANAFWVLDVATGLWHERRFLDGSPLGVAHRSRCHVSAFGKHLVGDWNSGNIYDMSEDYLDDFGTPIRRVRRSPYVAAESQWMYFSQIEIEADAGLGPFPPLLDGQGNVRDPQLMLRWSDDGGKNWSNEHNVAAGMGGDFSRRMRLFRMGRCWGTRGRIYELATSDPIPWRITDGYLQASPGYEPTERLSSQLQKQA